MMFKEILDIYLRTDTSAIVRSQNYMWLYEVNYVDTYNQLKIKEDKIQSYYLNNYRLIYFSKGSYSEIRHRHISTK